MVKHFLDEHNIPFEEVDVAKDREAATEMVEKTGQLAVPVTEVIYEDGKESEIIVGFDVARLKKVLRIED